MTPSLPSRAQAKALAKKHRQTLLVQNQKITHAKALEDLAVQFGFHDWNTFSAAIDRNQKPPYQANGTVSGRYLGQDFTARIRSVKTERPGWYRLQLAFDKPVDVVKFDSFSNFRQRIFATVGPDGHTRERTSDGSPQLQIL